jgi:hypothetical protein
VSAKLCRAPSPALRWLAAHCRPPHPRHVADIRVCPASERDEYTAKLVRQRPERPHWRW